MEGNHKEVRLHLETCKFEAVKVIYYGILKEILGRYWNWHTVEPGHTNSLSFISVQFIVKKVLVAQRDTTWQGRPGFLGIRYTGAF